MLALGFFVCSLFARMRGPFLFVVIEGEWFRKVHFLFLFFISLINWGRSKTSWPRPDQKALLKIFLRDSPSLYSLELLLRIIRVFYHWRGLQCLLYFVSKFIFNHHLFLSSLRVTCWLNTHLTLALLKQIVLHQGEGQRLLCDVLLIQSVAVDSLRLHIVLVHNGDLLNVFLFIINCLINIACFPINLLVNFSFFCTNKLTYRSHKSYQYQFYTFFL